jgi:hypothetical protein
MAENRFLLLAAPLPHQTAANEKVNFDCYIVTKFSELFCKMKTGNYQKGKICIIILLVFIANAFFSS